MSKRSWRHLDLEPAPSVRPQAPAPAGARTGAPVSSDPLLAAPAARYRLGDLEACRLELEALTPPHPVGYYRLLGLCAGRQGDFARAIEALEMARREAPEDSIVETAVLSARLALGETPDHPAAEERPLGEVAAAARWVHGQVLLAEGRYHEAGRAFAEAAARFAAVSAPSVAGRRLAVSCLGQAVAYLAAGEIDAAQQAFTRPGPRLPDSLPALVRQVYDLGESMRGLSAAETVAAVAPLLELIGGARLRVAFYDGREAVALSWEGLTE